jgi:hypothetical protein
MAATRVASIDELEEQVAVARNDRQIGDLVNDQQSRPTKESNHLMLKKVLYLQEE